MEKGEVGDGWNSELERDGRTALWNSGISCREATRRKFEPDTSKARSIKPRVNFELKARGSSPRFEPMLSQNPRRLWNILRPRVTQVCLSQWPICDSYKHQQLDRNWLYKPGRRGLRFSSFAMALYWPGGQEGTLDFGLKGISLFSPFVFFFFLTCSASVKLG